MLIALIFSLIQQLLDRVTRDNKMCYIMGDFNLDLLNTDLHSATNEFINALFSHFLYPLISRPTRLTSYSATLIDNIFTNNFSALCDNGLLINYLSDHLPIFTLCYTDAHSSTIKPKESLAIRNFSKHFLVITGQYQFFQPFLNSLKKSCTTD